MAVISVTAATDPPTTGTLSPEPPTLAADPSVLSMTVAPPGVKKIAVHITATFLIVGVSASSAPSSQYSTALRTGPRGPL